MALHLQPHVEYPALLLRLVDLPEVNRANCSVICDTSCLFVAFLADIGPPGGGPPPRGQPSSSPSPNDGPPSSGGIFSANLMLLTFVSL